MGRRGDVFPRTHSCTFDAESNSLRKSEDRQQQPLLLSFELADGNTDHTNPMTEDRNWNRPKVSKEKKALVVPGGTFLQGSVCASFRARSSIFSFDNLGQSHNRGMLSVDGMRCKSARTCVSPSVCQLCERPNSRSIEWHRSLCLASSSYPASDAGGAQTFGCIHSLMHIRRHGHSACIGAPMTHACHILPYVVS